jgi:hypothetical protein
MSRSSRIFNRDTVQRINLENCEDYLIQGWELLDDVLNTEKNRKILSMIKEMRVEFKKLLDQSYEVKKIYLNLSEDK